MLLEKFHAALELERAGNEDLALDCLWRSLGAAQEALQFEEIAEAFTIFTEQIESEEIEPEPFVLLGLMMISIPVLNVEPITKPRKELFDLACQLFDEWEWSKKELLHMG